MRPDNSKERFFRITKPRYILGVLLYLYPIQQEASLPKTNIEHRYTYNYLILT